MGTLGVCNSLELIYIHTSYSSEVYTRDLSKHSAEVHHGVLDAVLVPVLPVGIPDLRMKGSLEADIEVCRHGPLHAASPALWNSVGFERLLDTAPALGGSSTGFAEDILLCPHRACSGAFLVERAEEFSSVCLNSLCGLGIGPSETCSGFGTPHVLTKLQEIGLTFLQSLPQGLRRLELLGLELDLLLAALELLQ